MIRIIRIIILNYFLNLLINVIYIICYKFCTWVKTCKLSNLGYGSQVWSPYTLLNTLDLCTSPLLLYKVSSKEQVPFWQWLQVIISEGKVQVIFILYRFQELGTGDLLGPAPALCWGRATGVIWEIWHLLVSGPPRADLNSSRLVEIPSCWVTQQFPWLVFRECKKIDIIILRQVKRKRKKQQNFVFQKKNLLWALDPILWSVMVVRIVKPENWGAL